MTQITSRDNPLIKKLIKLQSSARYRKETGQFVLEGWRTVEDALLNGIQAECLLVSREWWEKRTETMNRVCAQVRETICLSEGLFRAFCDTATPQGVAALARMPVTAPIPDDNGVYLALDHLQDPANLGAIARTAEALGISGLILSADTVDPYSPKALRASMGTLLRIPLIPAPDLAGWLAQCSMETFACVVHGEAEPLGQITFSGGRVAVIGNEANGLSEPVIRACRRKVTIPMAGRAESLNASVAAALVMWEMLS